MSFDFRHGRERHHLAAHAADVEAAQAVRIEAVEIGDLRDDVVAAVVEVEARDARFRSKSTFRVEPISEIGHAERGGAVAVDQHMGARHIVGERILHDEELAALHRLGFDLLGDLVDLVGLADRADHVLHRQAAAVPGSDGGLKTSASTPATFERPPWICCWISAVERSRSAHDLKPQIAMPRLPAADPPPAPKPTTEKRRIVSGTGPTAASNWST